MTESSELRDAVTELKGSIDRLRDELVRKDVYAVDQKLLTKQIDDVDADVKELEGRIEKADERRAADRRLLITAFVLPLVLLVIQLYLAAQTGGPS
ncbi:hypothetical protein [Nocardioides lianchengensis]|uniref:Uncharacterized protein n=1 Tax=Nocardioides lianchengensis TaxID=1045774 RepID=A0A1G6LUM4_9ACTN|nr:hypothetical protein [Nocardioides lianchengensis]NYG12443.1 putative RNase H-like nuclease (RuvC/YqgF family) [Nocardioides lianchengensis]SDC46787.1 hypothetical protein SAMN05421872_102361 [Nocardioides lianchengensis]